jgi:FkbM family methyltransferase
MEKREELLNGNRLNCVDVGARGGMQTHWRAFAQNIELDAYEPDEAACKQQADARRPHENWFPRGLGAETGTGKLYVLTKASSSSLYPLNDAVNIAYDYGGYSGIERIADIPLVSLSDSIERNQRPLPNLIKLDAQGAELDILKGLRDPHWRDLMAVQTEAEFVDFYAGQPLFHDLDAFMRGKGFVMFDLLLQKRYRTDGKTRHYYLRRHLGIARNRHDITARTVAADVLYLRPPEDILKRGDPVAAAKFVTILLIYRCLDEALWFIESAVAARIFEASAAERMIDEVRRRAPKPRIWQRADWLGNQARRWMKRLNIGRARKIEYWLDRSWDH